MVVTDDITDRFGRFSEPFFLCVAIHIHRIKDPALYRFQTVPCIGKGTFLNDVFTVTTEAVSDDLFKRQILIAFH